MHADLVVATKLKFNPGTVPGSMHKAPAPLSPGEAHDRLHFRASFAAENGAGQRSGGGSLGRLGGGCFFVSSTLLLLVNAVTLRRERSIFFNRLAILILLYSGIIGYDSLYIKPDPTAGHIVFLVRLPEEQHPAGSGGCNMRSSRSCSASKNPVFFSFY
uniref:Uncharacterized protein n=1 Tax=Morchella brunnea TaxID=1174671 RepID=A0A8K1I5I0_9PEZI|nr:hypothetical protein LK370_mgp246 [Morchella brunnea]UBU98345.1 hypothetical protein [Morchella brunnea]